MPIPWFVIAMGVGVVNLVKAYRDDVKKARRDEIRKEERMLAYKEMLGSLNVMIDYYKDRDQEKLKKCRMLKGQISNEEGEDVKTFGRIKADYTKLWNEYLDSTK